MRDSKLWGPCGKLFDGFLQWLNDTDMIFHDDTFVDGSGVIVKEDQALSQCGFSVVSVVKKEDDAAVDSSENPDVPNDCTCRNASNPFHVCSTHCPDATGVMVLVLVGSLNRKLLWGYLCKQFMGHCMGTPNPRPELNLWPSLLR